jgi:hypothetical protein
MQKSKNIGLIRYEFIAYIPIFDIIDNGKIDINSIVKTKKRICGLFDAEPLDWEYARIVVSDSSKAKHSHAIARMPKSPTAPVFLMLRNDLYILDSLISGL